MNEELLKDLDIKINEIFFHYSNSINRIRAEGASPTILDLVHVNYYGSSMPLNQLSSIISEEGKYLIVSPYDKTLLKDIANVISSSKLDLSLNVEGEKIRIFIPPLNEEKRKDFVKKVKEIAENAKINVRTLRHEIIKKINSETISKDDKEFYLTQIESKISTVNTKIEEILKEKSEKLMKI